MYHRRADGEEGEDDVVVRVPPCVLAKQNVRETSVVCHSLTQTLTHKGDEDSMKISK